MGISSRWLAFSFLSFIFLNGSSWIHKRSSISIRILQNPLGSNNEVPSNGYSSSSSYLGAFLLHCVVPTREDRNFREENLK